MSGLAFWCAINALIIKGNIYSDIVDHYSRVSKQVVE